MTLAFQGIGIAAACPVAIGPAFIDTRGRLGVAHAIIESEQIEAEIARFDLAVAAARRGLQMVRSQIPGSTPPKVIELVDAHLLMLDDATLLEEVRRIVANERCNAEWALQRHRDALVEVFDQMDDPYLRTRRDDIEHIVHQIQRHLHTEGGSAELDGLGLERAVVVARDLTPADAILLRQRGAAAFVTEFGGPMSHTAILARSLGVPAVMGVHDITHYLRSGELLVVDGETGTVLAKADTSTLEYYRQRIRASEERQRRLRNLVDQPTRTRDGVTVSLQANLELPEDVEIARANGISGVGLYRTEFLYMNRSDLPDEEEHLATYAAMVADLDGIPITIRTLDLGVDKGADGLNACGGSFSNPALGLRAIRLCLKEPALFRPQLRAILRASALGPVRLMIPLVTNVHELDTVIALIEELKGELQRDGLAYNDALPVGAMIEVPAAALAARAIARRADFLSIGTNDLIQYTLAVDRLDDSVNYLFDPIHPAILRLIRMTIEAAGAARIPVGMCGEMAGDTRFTRLLIGLGLRELSMQPGGILDVKEILLQADAEDLSRRTAELLAQLDTAEPARLLDALNLG